jgi:uncharacterized protein (DUF1800 family)
MNTAGRCTATRTGARRAAGGGLRAVLAGALLLAWGAAFAQAMGEDDARHLLNRLQFGATPAEVRDAARLSRAQAVDRALSGVRTTPATPLPEWTRDWTPRRQLREASEEERRALLDQEIRRGFELRGWWLEEMLASPSPLTERLTLFWHNHFTSSLQKVKSVNLVARQNLLLRRHALGNFRELLHAVARDPAMLVYLDSASNRRGQPNENFAREVMELFTLGEGRYAEADIREAARAFTGWSIDPETGGFLFRRFAHDEGEKTVLGRTGRFDGDDVLGILLEQPGMGELLVGKLWREFVSPDPDPAEVRRLARRWREAGWETKPVLREMLLSRAFWSADNRGSLVKSPVDLVVGTLHTFGIAVDDGMPFALILNGLGQNLLNPPNVKGWPGGEAWINSSTLLARKQFVERLFRAEEMPVAARMVDMERRPLREQAYPMREQANPMREQAGPLPKGTNRMGEEGRERMRRAMLQTQFDDRRWSAGFGATPLPEDLNRVVLATGQANAQVVEPSAGLRAQVRALVLDPAYQLK